MVVPCCCPRGQVHASAALHIRYQFSLRRSVRRRVETLFSPPRIGLPEKSLLPLQDLSGPPAFLADVCSLCETLTSTTTRCRDSHRSGYFRPGLIFFRLPLAPPLPPSSRLWALSGDQRRSRTASAPLPVLRPAHTPEFQNTTTVWESPTRQISSIGLGRARHHTLEPTLCRGGRRCFDPSEIRLLLRCRPRSAKQWSWCRKAGGISGVYEGCSDWSRM